MLEFNCHSSWQGCVYSVSINSKSDLILMMLMGLSLYQIQAIFNANSCMGYDGDLNVVKFNKALFSPNGGRQLANITVPLDHFPIHSLTSKVFSFMVKKGKRFSGKVTPLFDNMLVQPTQAEGDSSERLSVEQSSTSLAPTVSPKMSLLPDQLLAQTSEGPFAQQLVPSPRPIPSPSPKPSPPPSPTPIIPDSIPEPTGENLGDHSSNDKSLSGNEDEMTLPMS
ncbi:hypothetical protein Tco_1484366 [Tanacetum coccineum]